MIEASETSNAVHPTNVITNTSKIRNIVMSLEACIEVDTDNAGDH